MKGFVLMDRCLINRGINKLYDVLVFILKNNLKTTDASVDDFQLN